MTQNLLTYLNACCVDLRRFVDSELTGEAEAGHPGHPSRSYYTLLRALRATPFYTGAWPAVGQQWWIA